MMRLEDLEEVYRIELDSYPTPWPMKCFTDELTKNRYARYVVGIAPEGEIAGYAGMWIIKGEAHITNVAVCPGSRRMRVAEQLLVSQVEYALARRAKSIYLEVRRYNLPAQRLYSRFSFVATKVRERYYRDNGEDAIELRIRDTSDPKFLSSLRLRKAELAERLGGFCGQASSVVR